MQDRPKHIVLLHGLAFIRTGNLFWERSAEMVKTSQLRSFKTENDNMKIPKIRRNYSKARVTAIAHDFIAFPKGSWSYFIEDVDSWNSNFYAFHLLYTNFIWHPSIQTWNPINFEAEKNFYSNPNVRIFC